MKYSEPLTESYFYILLCLKEGPNHGYGIMQRVKELSDERVNIGSGTMYGATGKMIKKKWIQEIKSPVDDRKRMYQLTELGEAALANEYIRLLSLIESAKLILKEA
ncbi:helix-turn-helix transcriptional regulator [Eubacteriaceae bacterium ES2]|nr:helix-turn-helix transcriptional regulator [Eubacteriaceae bacterium ES2]